MVVGLQANRRILPFPLGFFGNFLPFATLSNGNRRYAPGRLAKRIFSSWLTKPHTSLLHFLLLPVCGCTHTLPKMAWLMLTRSLLHTDWLTDWLTEDRILSSRFPKFWFLLAKTFWLRWDLGWRVSQKLGDFSLSLSSFADFLNAGRLGHTDQMMNFTALKFEHNRRLWCLGAELIG